MNKYSKDLAKSKDLKAIDALVDNNAIIQAWLKGFPDLHVSNANAGLIMQDFVNYTL